MGNKLSSYPIGRVLINHPGSNLPALPLPADSSSNKLYEPLDRYLKRIIVEIESYYGKMTKKTFTPIFEVEPLATFQVTINVEQRFGVAVPLDEQDLTGAPSSHTLDLARATRDQNRDQMSEETKKLLVKDKTLQNVIILLGIVILYNKKLIEFVQKASAYPSTAASEVVKSSLKNTQKLNEKFISKLKTLKEHLIRYTYFLENVLLHYTAFTHIELEEFSTLNEEKKCIQKIISRMNPEELHHLVHKDVVVYPEHVLSLVLGMNDSVTYHLKELPSDIRYHQTDKYWVNNYIKNSSFETNLDREHLDDALKHLGFSESRSLVLKKCLSENPYQDHQPLLYWVKAYIDSMFSYDILLNSFSRYPYNPNIVDEWHTVTVSRDNPDDLDEDDLKGEVNYINLTNCNLYNLPKQVENHLKSLNEKRLFFHGTSHNHADNIIHNGIQLSEGSETQDFSHKDGFYITSEIIYALDWAKYKSFSNNAAVIVFYVDPEILNKYTRLNLSNDQEKWKHVITYNRRGRDRRVNIPKQTIKEYKQADYVEGPMCSNPKGVASSQEPKGFGRTEKTQICLKSNGVARLFGNIESINAVLFM